MKFAYQRLLSQVLVIASSIILILLLPVHNLITINAAILTTTLTHRLYWEIRLREIPRLKDWATSLIKTVFWVSTFYILYVLAGMIGLWGFLLLTIALAAWRIYVGRELFDTYTAWAADRAWGRTKEDFDLEEALNLNEQETSRGQFTINRTTRIEGQSNTSTQESSDFVDEQKHSGEDQTQMQAMLSKDSQDSKPRIRSRKRKTMPIVSEDLGTRTKVKQ